ncbi:MAG: alpha/beta fold hydrolase [Acidobacteriaceae bacterium]
MRAFVDTSGAEPVRGFLHPAASASADALVLTHGAGANCQAPLLVALADAFAASGTTVLRCDLPFRQAKPQGPPMRTAERDQAGLKAAVQAMRRQTQAHRIFLAGHSYGGRMASMLAAREPDLVEALLLLSYPLHPPKAPQQMRTQHFPSLETPALFVSGTRDGFGTIAELGAALRLIPARTRLLPVESAGHELIGKRNRDELPKVVAEAFRAFTRLPG